MFCRRRDRDRGFSLFSWILLLFLGQDQEFFLLFLFLTFFLVECVFSLFFSWILLFSWSKACFLIKSFFYVFPPQSIRCMMMTTYCNFSCSVPKVWYLYGEVEVVLYNTLLNCTSKVIPVRWDSLLYYGTATHVGKDF